MLSILCLGVLLVYYVKANSWLHCVNFPLDASINNIKECLSLADGINTSAPFGLDDNMVYQIKTPNSPSCKFSKSTNEPTKYIHNNTYRLIWPSRTYLIPTSKLTLYIKEPSSPDTFNMWARVQNLFIDLNLPPNRGYANCPDYVLERERAPCYADIIIPKIFPGFYNFLWVWEPNPDMFFTSCFTAEIIEAQDIQSPSKNLSGSKHNSDDPPCVQENKDCHVFINGMREERGIYITEVYTLLFALIIFLSIVIYSFKYYLGKLYKYIAYSRIPPKISTSGCINNTTRIFQYKILDVPAMQYMVLFTYLVLQLVLLILATPSEELALKSTGTFLAVNIILTILLPLRYSPIRILTRISYEHYLFFHRSLGMIILVLSLLHTLFYMINLSRPLLQIEHFELRHLFIPLPRTFGTLALITVSFITLLSTTYVRRMYFNVFRFSHYLYVLFIIFTALHRPYFIPYAIFCAVVIGIDYLIHIVQSCAKYKATAEVHENTYMVIKFNKTHKIRTEPGQHLYIRVPGVSKYEAHPFSIITHSNSPIIELGIKPLGDYTKKLIEYIKTHKQFYIHVSGPHGALRFNYLRYEELVLICGGVGVTPFIGLLKEIYFGSRTESRLKNITFVWFCRDEVIYKVYEDFFTECIEMNVAKGAGTDVAPLFMPIISIKNRPIDSSVFQSVNIEEIFSDLLDLHTEEDVLDMIENGEFVKTFRRIGLLCCGSKNLIDDVWRNSTKYSNDHNRIDFHRHLFEF